MQLFVMRDRSLQQKAKRAKHRDRNGVGGRGGTRDANELWARTRHERLSRAVAVGLDRVTSCHCYLT